MAKFKKGDVVRYKDDDDHIQWFEILVTSKKKKNGIWFSGVVINPKGSAYRVGQYNRHWVRHTFIKVDYPKGYYLTQAPINP